jgi:hypothetical protein
MSRARERGHVERLAVAGVDQVLRAQQVSGRSVDIHEPKYRAACELVADGGVADELGLLMDEAGLAGRPCNLEDPDDNRLRIATPRS